MNVLLGFLDAHAALAANSQGCLEDCDRRGNRREGSLEDVGQCVGPRLACQDSNMAEASTNITSRR